jgi:HrpA-like RNA helicase
MASSLFGEHLTELKIHPILNNIIATTSKTPVVAILAGTGSGKTTGIPQQFARCDNTEKNMIVSIPTVMAAKYHNKYAKDMNPDIKEKFSFGAGGIKDSSFGKTKITYGTTQTVTNFLRYLFRNVSIRSQLNNYIIMIDESHHPTSENYYLMAFVNWLITKGFDIKVIIASATPSEQPFSHLKEAVPFIAETTQHPITTHWQVTDFIKYVSSDGLRDHFDTEYLEHLVFEKLNAIVADPTTHDVLIFVCGEKDADDWASKAETKYNMFGFTGLACYANMGESEMTALAEKYSKKRLIFSTNVAESSITLGDITDVVDTLLQNTSITNSRKRKTIIKRLISQAASKQRAGRSGRVRAGRYHPMCSERVYYYLTEFIQNEFSTMDKMRPTLMFLSDNLPAMEILEISPLEYTSMLGEMVEMGICTGDQKVTSLGEQINKIPFPIDLSVAYLKSLEMCKKDEASDIEIMYLMLFCAVIETRSATGNNFVFIPQDIRRSGQAVKASHIRDTIAPFATLSNGSTVDTEMCIAMKVFCAFQQRDKKSAHDWCVENGFIGKVLFAIDRHFSTLCSLVFPRRISSEFFRDINLLIDEKLYTAFIPYFASVFKEIAVLDGMGNCIFPTGIRWNVENKSMARIHNEPSRGERIIILDTTTFSVKGREMTIVTMCIPIA